jgi:poly-gamma-glutamate synthesis protein (capsule biosynthesis protein)
MTRSIFSYLLALTTLLSACSSAPQPIQSSSADVQPPLLSTLTPSADQQTSAEEFIGRVVDLDGTPISGAKVESSGQTATSDQDGWFRFSGDSLPQWIKVSADGFISRTRAAAPEIPVLFRLSPDDGKTTVIHFAGDTMFGRRFYDPNEDDYAADGLLPLKPTVDDHMKLLSPVRPLLEEADLTVVNLETTLSVQPYFAKRGPRPAAFHTTSDYVYASHTNSALALKQSGIDIVDIGNNHNYDLLELGLSTSLSSLDQAGLLHFGAGTNEANAWAPAIVSSKGQTIAFVGCTTVRIPSSSITKTDVPYVASDLRKKGGAAYCSEAPLRAAIIAAKKEVDTVVVMIHGGKEYSRIPLSRIVYLTEIARQAGATLIINHHSHVVSGFSWKGQSLTAWSMGNFLFDQTVWPSFESYMLAVYVQEGKVVRAFVEPLIIDGFLPHGLTDELADYVVRGAAGRNPGPFVMESGAMEVDLEGRALQASYTQTVNGGSDSGTIVPVPPALWISGFKGTGNVLLGRDLLWVGGFENDEVNSAFHAAPLWNLDLGNIQIGQDYAYEGEIGVRLTRGASSVNDAVTTNTHRVLVEPFTNLSITGMIRIHQGVPAYVQLSWYDATFGPSFLKTIEPIEVQADGTWQPFRLDAPVPKNAVALGVYLRLSPPDKGIVNADFDNIRIIEWSRPNSPYSPLYNYALVTGSGELTYTQQILPGAERWLITDPTIKPIN